MPAAAVIPAPLVYIKIVAVKKLVVYSWDVAWGPPMWCDDRARPALVWNFCSRPVYFEKNRVFKAGLLA